MCSALQYSVAESIRTVTTLIYLIIVDDSVGHTAEQITEYCPCSVASTHQMTKTTYILIPVNGSVFPNVTIYSDSLFINDCYHWPRQHLIRNKAKSLVSSQLRKKENIIKFQDEK